QPGLGGGVTGCGGGRRFVQQAAGRGDDQPGAAAALAFQGLDPPPAVLVLGLGRRRGRRGWLRTLGRAEDASHGELSLLSGCGWVTDRMPPLVEYTVLKGRQRWLRFPL